MVYNPKLATPSIVNENKIAIYPNPAKENITIENAQDNKLGIYDVVGKKILQTFIASYKETVNIESLARGVYMIQTIDKDGEKKVVKLIKE
jgi:hypothetical protein